jgi:acyl carrier protein
MSTVDSLKRIIRDALHLGDRAHSLTASSPLMGAIAEFDSMAVVTVLTMIEDEFGFSISDDEVSADIFETLGTLAAFVDGKVGN